MENAVIARNLERQNALPHRNAWLLIIDPILSQKRKRNNPCRNIKAIKYERAQRQPLSGMELERLRNACETVRDKAMIEMLYSTGCRVTELERLDIADVDFEQKEVHLFGKGDKHRTSYLNVKAELS